MSKKVRDLMIPVQNYACVPEDSPLFEVIIALEEVQQKFKDMYYKHRAVLVCGEKGKIVGKIGLIDVLRALDPQYKELGEIGMITRFGVNLEFLKSMKDQFRLFKEPLDSLCRKVATIKAKEAMHTPVEGEFVEIDASLNEAIHKFVIGQHQSLLVLDKGEIVGVLRLSDVFMEVAQMIKQCEI
jgi:CBS domain-containing protein